MTHLNIFTSIIFFLWIHFQHCRRINLHLLIKTVNMNNFWVLCELQEDRILLSSSLLLFNYYSVCSNTWPSHLWESYSRTIKRPAKTSRKRPRLWENDQHCSWLLQMTQMTSAECSRVGFHTSHFHKFTCYTCHHFLEVSYAKSRQHVVQRLLIVTSLIEINFTLSVRSVFSFFHFFLT